MAYNVLCLDGGGIKGLVSVVLLERLSRVPELGAWLNHVHLIAGTSTGGLIALGLAAGKTLGELRDMYVQQGARIFGDSFLDNVKDLGKVIGADYDAANLETVLIQSLGPTTKLGDLSKRVLIATFDLDNEDSQQRSWKPKLFHNFPGPDSDAATLAFKAGLYTAAAPTFFPSVDGYIDGAVYAPNPSMCALAQTQDGRTGEHVSLSEVRLLSIGTGISLRHVAGRAHDWGYVQWAKPLVDLLFDGVSGIADFQCKQMLGARYHRLAPVFPPGRVIAMDDVKTIPYLLDFAASVPIEASIAWLRDNWTR